MEKDMIVFKKTVNNKKTGFTLIEILVVISILGAFFIAAITIALISLRNLKSSENRILATRYAEELLEWIRSEKETDWKRLTEPPDNTLKTYCFNGEIQQWPVESTPNECKSDPNKIKNIFTRFGQIRYNSTSKRVVTNVYVKWYEGDNEQTVGLNTIFEQYE
jgi:prepilin-type N-terminal cleavage/methylation domain-containing protein